LAAACAEKNANLEEVIRLLEECTTLERESEIVDIASLSLTDLANHIEATHHAFLRGIFPHLNELIEQVMRTHAGKEPRLYEVRAAFLALRSELELHMAKEERILFPMVRQLDTALSLPRFHFGSIANPIQQMEYEHDQASDLLAKIREASDGFAVPDWACATYLAMLDTLKQLEADLFQHIHKENNVLFPRAMELEDEHRARDDRGSQDG
jgi:regulator of cell morphogenesis and NO signaling